MDGLTLELGRVTVSKSKLHTRNFLFLHQFSATSQPFKVISLGTLNLKLAITFCVVNLVGGRNRINRPFPRSSNSRF